MFSRLSAKCLEWGVPCVSPESLRWQIEVPLVIAKYIETLATFSSYPNLTLLSWSDISEKDGNFYLSGIWMNEVMVESVMAIGEYYWKGQTPPPEAPLIALSPVTARHRLQPDMAEQLVKSNSSPDTHLVESQFAFQMYPYMFKYKFTISEIQKVFDVLTKIAKMPIYQKRKARRTLREAQGVLSWGNLHEFHRLLQIAEEGRTAYRSKKLEDSLPDLAPRKSLLPTKAPGLSLSDDLG